MVNLDFEDLKSIVNSGAGVAMIGLGSAKGPGRADAATMEALHSPLLDIDMSDARGALINVVGGSSLTLGEAERCSQLIKEKISPNAKIIWGAAVKEELGDELRVMLVLTGVKSDQIHGSTENRQLERFATGKSNSSIDSRAGSGPHEAEDQHQADDENDTVTLTDTVDALVRRSGHRRKHRREPRTQERPTHHRWAHCSR